MASVPSFFKLPVITRYQLAATAAAVIMGLAALGRYFVDGMAADNLLTWTRITSVVAFVLFAGCAHLFRYVRRNPHGFVFLAITPLICHLTLMLYFSGVEPGLLLATVTAIGISAAMLDSRPWLKILLTTWCISLLAAIWSVLEPQTSVVNASIIIIAACVFAFIITSGFNDSRAELERVALVLEESQAFSGVGAWQKNLITGETRWSKTTYDILGLPYDEVPTTSLSGRVDNETESKLHRATQTMLATGEPYDVVDQIRTASGKMIWIHARGKVRLEDGVPVRAMGVFSDITEQVEHEHALTQAKEDAEAAATARAQFIANMSHEIRTPMNGVLGMTAMLAQEELPPNAQHLVNVIRTSGESLLNIINDILDFSKIEAGALTLEARPFSVASIVEGAIDMVRQSIDDKKLNLNLYLPGEADGAPRTYLGDEQRIRQVLVNLLSNAVKFTHRGDITVSVNCRRRDADDYMLAVSVSDTGVGIPAAKQASLFEAFTQADASTTREYGGTGLGLAISRELVAQMQGTIEVHSQPGMGSTFTFRVPLTPTDEMVPESRPAAAQPERAASREEPEMAEESASSLRILLAEDNPVNQKVAAMMLKKLGYAAQLADNGREAVEAVEAARFDVVFMDLQMPELDGLEATRAIRANETIIQPRIIALTANAMDEDKRRCFEAGMDYFVAKPMRMDDLQQAIDSVAAG